MLLRGGDGAGSGRARTASRRRLDQRMEEIRLLRGEVSHHLRREAEDLSEVAGRTGDEDARQRADGAKRKADRMGKMLADDVALDVLMERRG